MVTLVGQGQDSEKVQKGCRSLLEAKHKKTNKQKENPKKP